MLTTIVITLVLLICFLLVSLTVLQLRSMYGKHTMKEIDYQRIQLQNWPTQKWQSSSPEQQGINSTKLLELVKYYEAYQDRHKAALIDSISIIRNGYIIADCYFNPLFPPSQKHIINSCTKSIVSILIGIAIDKDFIKDVELPVLDFFEDIGLENIDKRLERMTLKDLLTMRTGWNSQDSYLYKWVGLFEMQATQNWAEHILKLPFEAAPNTRFDYSNMASFLLSVILTKSCRTDSLTFAKKYLFSPLGIADVLWEKSPKGTYIGFARMWLKPHDMAKIGLLMLQKGQWEGQQIVSESWVKASIQAHSFPKQYRYVYDQNNKKNFGISGANWIFSNWLRPFTDGYGYQWWLDKSGMFSAIGVGGQYIMVVPKEQLIVVVTSKLGGKDSFLPVKLLKEFILPAIESNAPIPENRGATHQLNTYATPPEIQQKEKIVPQLLPIVEQISGVKYSIDESLGSNPWQCNNLCLDFKAGANDAIFSYTTINNERIQFEIGLKNQYIITDCHGKRYAARGSWIEKNTFSIEVEVIGYASKNQWVLTFEKDEIKVEEIGVTGNYCYTGKAKRL